MISFLITLVAVIFIALSAKHVFNAKKGAQLAQKISKDDQPVATAPPRRVPSPVVKSKDTGKIVR